MWQMNADGTPVLMFRETLDLLCLVVRWLQGEFGVR